MVSITVDQEKCSLCKICVEACPSEIYFVKLRGIEVDKDKCIGCQNCVTMCPVEDFGEKPILSVHNGKSGISADFYEKCLRFDKSWHCKLCAEVCPVGAITFVGECQLNKENLKDCLEEDGKDCRICLEACPEGAIRVRRNDNE